MKIYTVSELNLEAREAMLLAFEYPISVKGEITDFRTSKGHQYFKLRDHNGKYTVECVICLLYTSPSPRDRTRSRMPSSA